MSPARSEVDPMHRIQRARVGNDAVSGKPRAVVGGVDSWGRGTATLRRWNLGAEDDVAARLAVAGLTLRHRCTHDAATVFAALRLAQHAPGVAGQLWRAWRRCHERAVLDWRLQTLGLREPPPAGPPPPAPPEITTELRHAAEVYLQETARGVTDLYGRLARRDLVPDGCGEPARYLRNLLGRCRAKKWLTTNDGGRASLPGPRLVQARRETGWDGEWA